MSRKSTAKCGTTSAYRQHWRKGEEPCAPCRLAWNAYMRGYRKTPAARAAATAYNTARTRALERLAKRYPNVFYTYLTEERGKA
jgi:hypothetical protein